MNAMVVITYWRLYFADPHSVTSDGQLGQFYLEVYLHAVGPLLQWIDVTFIHRGFRRLRPAFLWLFGVISVYILWMELILQRFNDSPMGSVTSGLPYPFLNDLALDGRATFYLVNFTVATILLLVFAGLAWLVRQAFPRREGPAALHENRDSAV